ncbi:MAG TPA: hypothetical protein VJR89_01075 [Polyangiales bacterium]|nr:hypothetical protein [Polyangiales bacterium]
MPEPMIRGHIIQQTVRYFRNECDQDTALRIDATLPLELKALLRELVPAHWYPRRHEAELLAAIAHVVGNEEAVRRMLLRCGASMAVGENEFMKLLMRVLTPELFLKKLGAFWTRDHQDSGGYRVERLDLEGRNASLRLTGIAGYTHSALLWQGWIHEIFRQISTVGSDVQQSGWTWSEPAPEAVSFEVKWS